MEKEKQRQTTETLEHLKEENHHRQLEKQWLFTPGIELLTKKLIKSREIVMGMANINRTMKQTGYNEGIRIGYAHGSKQRPFNTIQPAPYPDAETQLHAMLKDFGNIKPAIVEQLQQDPNIPLATLQQRLGWSISASTQTPPGKPDAREANKESM